MVISLLRPSFQLGFARCASESVNPHLWRGLVGAWIPALGVTGNTLFDVSGRGNHGTLTDMDAATDWAIGGDGYALDFDGVDDHIIIPDSASLNSPTHGLSIVSSINKMDTGLEGVFEKTIGGAVNSQYSLLMEVGRFKFRVIKTQSNTIASDDIFPDNKTTSVAGTWDGLIMLSYINAKVQQETRAVTAPITSGAGVTLIGSLSRSDLRFTGFMNYLYLYNRALMQPELQLLHIDPLAPFRQRDRFRGLSIPPVSLTLRNPKNRILQHLLTR